MISLKSLLFIVAVAAAGTSGLVARTQFWASMLVALTLGILLLASCRAWFAPQLRTFWGPFTVTGAVYLAIVSLQPLQELYYNLPTTQLIVYGLEKLQATSNAATGPVHATAVAIGSVYRENGTVYRINRTTTMPAPIPAPAYSSSGYSAPVYAPALSATSLTFVRPVLFRMATGYGAVDGFPAEARAFLWVGQSLWSLLLALAAGMTCCWLFRSKQAAA